MAIRICSGKGECLTQTDDPHLYCKQDDVTCEFKCEPMKCPNYLVCGDIAPKWYFSCHHGTCVRCAIHEFGFLEFSEDECPVCLDTKTCVKFPKCSHKQCIDCFKRCQFGKPKKDIPFPIPELEDEYYDTSDDPKWTRIQLVVNWWCEIDLEDAKHDMDYEREQNLRCCPLCRK